MEVEITCKYCDHKTVRHIYSDSTLENMKCNKCGDTNLVAKDRNKGKVDTYAGAPPFPDKKKKDVPIEWGGD